LLRGKFPPSENVPPTLKKDEAAQKRVCPGKEGKNKENSKVKPETGTTLEAGIRTGGRGRRGKGMGEC